MKRNCFIRSALFFFTAALSCLGQTSSGLKDAVVLIIRHAEKPESGRELSPAGYHRADAYVKYFSHFQMEGKTVALDGLFAAADSRNSERPRLTLEPLSKALGLALDTNFTDKAPALLADALKSKPHGKALLVCWRHGQIPSLLQSLGADPGALLPGGQWPADQFAWVVELRYDSEGKLMADRSRRVEEKF